MFSPKSPRSVRFSPRAMGRWPRLPMATADASGCCSSSCRRGVSSAVRKMRGSTAHSSVSPQSSSGPSRSSSSTGTYTAAGFSASSAAVTCSAFCTEQVKRIACPALRRIRQGEGRQLPAGWDVHPPLCQLLQQLPAQTVDGAGGYRQSLIQLDFDTVCCEYGAAGLAQPLPQLLRCYRAVPGFLRYSAVHGEGRAAVDGAGAAQPHRFVSPY